MDTAIKSAKNERLKELRKLHDRKHRERTGLFCAEGEDMLAEALRFGAMPEALFFDPEEIDPAAPPLAGLPQEVEVVPVRGEALRASGSLGSGSRLIGVWRQRWAKLDVAGEEPSRVIVYLHEVSDPGNVGTVLRSALALVPSIVALSPGTADPFSPKAVRASMGAIFGQAVTRTSFDRLGTDSVRRLVALAPRAGNPLREAGLRAPVTLCLGSERLGLPDEVLAGCDEVCHVPLRPDGTESLNVAVTAALCLYEIAIAGESSGGD